MFLSFLTKAINASEWLVQSVALSCESGFDGHALIRISLSQARPIFVIERRTKENLDAVKLTPVSAQCFLLLLLSSEMI